MAAVWGAAAAGASLGAAGTRRLCGADRGDSTITTLPSRNVLTYTHGSGRDAEIGESTMTQTQIIVALADKCEMPKKTAKAMMDNLGLTAVTEVKKNGVFILPGIGRLVKVERKARMGRNPATGAVIKIAAKKVVKFRIAKAAKEAIVPVKAKKATA
jgi:DNA-binding protein HU-beta